MPVWDRDPLAGRWVIHAPARGERPQRVSPRNRSGRRAGCPFCRGNEDQTPEELARVDDGQGGWQVRVFPNLYPAVRPVEPCGELRSGLPVTGAHEVVVLSPDHDRGYADLDDDEATTALGMVFDRIGHHQRAGRAYVQAFVNHGAAAGASIQHPHAQLVALDVVPPRVAAEAEATADAACAICEVLTDEELAVGTVGGVRSLCPPWSAASSELLLAPLDHDGSAAPDALAVLLRDDLHRLRTALGDTAYNVVLHPEGIGGVRHGHVHVYPRTAVRAGFELGTGVIINAAAPAASAARLRSLEG